MSVNSTTSETSVRASWNAEHWLATGCSGHGEEVKNICAKAAQELGNRTGYLPLAAPISMLVFLLVSPELSKYWLPTLVLYLLMVIAASTRIALAKRLITPNNNDLLILARRYQIAVDITAFTWGSLVGLMLLVRGIDQITELALVASLGITAGAFISLTLDLSLWRRFITVLWLPILTMTATVATQGIENGWLLLSFESLFTAFAGIQGQRIVREYISGLLSRFNLENAVSMIADQRDELRAHQKQLDLLLAQTHNLSYYDQLTGIGSRTHFHERLEANISASHISGKTFALLYLDLDGFKDINDTLGHDAGDELLKTVARRVCTLLRSSDFAARLGSDELALLINDVVEDQDAAGIMQRCLKEIQVPVILNGKMICPRASIGVALYPADGDNTLALLKSAESAMNVAKNGTKPHYARYTPEMSLAARQRITIEQELRPALTNGQFLLHFQPQIDARNGAACGVEALLRWQHPERGLIPPVQFIPVAENTGMIDEIGEWVLHSACQQAAEWFSKGVPEFTVAVNISPLQLLDPGFIDIVQGALNNTGLSANRLELEFTESTIQTNIESREMLSQLKEIGVRIAIDDFGTGYSSLASLKELPIDRVKIDRIFVTDLLNSEQDTALLGNIIDMAHILGCDVVAEGVEEKAHIDKLQALNCDCLQGFFYSRPIDAGEIPAAMRNIGDFPMDKLLITAGTRR